jgi:GTPase SAR1 family protein
MPNSLTVLRTMGAKLSRLRVQKQNRSQVQQSPPSPRLPNVQFRVLVIGRANAGKTSILQRVCDTTESPEIYRRGPRGTRERVRGRDVLVSDPVDVFFLISFSGRLTSTPQQRLSMLFCYFLSVTHRAGRLMLRTLPCSVVTTTSRTSSFLQITQVIFSTTLVDLRLVVKMS